MTGCFVKSDEDIVKLCYFTIGQLRLLTQPFPYQEWVNWISPQFHISIIIIHTIILYSTTYSPISVPVVTIFITSAFPTSVQLLCQNEKMLELSFHLIFHFGCACCLWGSPYWIGWEYCWLHNTSPSMQIN